MTREEIFNELKDMIVDNLGIDEEKISMDTSLAEDLGADSLDVVELIMEIEEAYDFEISDDDAENMTTIGDAVSYIEESQK